jgi:lipoyl-dependent peroxiredoxin subunit D
VCPTEIAAFGRLEREFRARDAQLLGVSIDAEYVHLAWRREKQELRGLPFPMLADIKRELAGELGILDPEAGVAQRATFIVDPQGVLAAAAASRNSAFTARLQELATRHLDAAHVSAAHAAAAIMAMNNVYYRFLHLVEDEEYGKLPARLRMSVIGNPGIAKADFELLSLAVSAINGCGTCVASHERQLRQHGFTREAVQSAVRVAATVHAVARVLESSGGQQVGSAAAA